VETILLYVSVVLMVAVVVYLVAAMVRSIQSEKRSQNIKKTWANFGLSIALCILFFTSWVAQGFAQWHEFVQDQRAHREPIVAEDFVAEFANATLENWQSEFLQLFSFVVLAAILIHHGSSESKDSDDRMEAALRRIEQRLDEMGGKKSKS
jgi:purine-cytosine permease-like protein